MSNQPAVSDEWGTDGALAGGFFALGIASIFAMSVGQFTGDHLTALVIGTPMFVGAMACAFAYKRLHGDRAGFDDV